MEKEVVIYTITQKVQNARDSATAMENHTRRLKWKYILKQLILPVSFSPVVCVGTSNLIASIPGPSILALNIRTFT